MSEIRGFKSEMSFKKAFKAIKSFKSVWKRFFTLFAKNGYIFTKITVLKNHIQNSWKDPRPKKFSRFGLRLYCF